MQITQHFSRHEMECPHCGLCLMQDRFMEGLESLRKVWGKPIVVLSGYRCKTHNADVGGKKASQHLKGNAADLSTHGLSDEDLSTFLTLCKAIFNAVEIIGPNSVHVDFGSKRHWSY